MTKVLGHRGLRQDKDMDENSLAAVEAAFRYADGVEIDVSVSAEDTPYLVHDIGRGVLSRSAYILRRQLDRPSAKAAGKKRLDQMKDREIDALRLKKGAKLAKLSEVFALASRYPGKTINIELKGEGSAGPVMKALRKAIDAGQVARDQIIITSFDHKAVLEAKQKDPAIKCGLILASSARGKAAIFPWSGDAAINPRGDAARRYRAHNKKTLTSALAKSISPDYFVMAAGDVDAAKAAEIRAHHPQAKLMVWTSREKPPSRNGRVSRLLGDPDIRPHLDTVITDYPRQMKKLLSVMEK